MRVRLRAELLVREMEGKGYSVEVTWLGPEDVAVELTQGGEWVLFAVGLGPDGQVFAHRV
jgi:hypothetical protein